MIGDFFDRDLKNGYTIVLFCLSSRPELKYSWIADASKATNDFDILDRSTPPVRIHLFAKHIAHQYRYFYWYSITFLFFFFSFFFINYSSHVSLYFQKCKGKSGTYRSADFYWDYITSRFRIRDCLLIDRLINSCKMIINLRDNNELWIDDSEFKTEYQSF